VPPDFLCAINGLGRQSISFSFSAHLFLLFPLRLRFLLLLLPCASRFPSLQSGERNHAETTRLSLCARSIGRSAVRVWAQFQRARIHGAHNALVTKSFRRSLSPKLFCRRERTSAVYTSLIIAAVNYAVLSFGFLRFIFFIS